MADLPVAFLAMTTTNLKNRDILLGMTAQLSNRSHVLDLVGLNIGMKSESLGHAPEEDLQL